jgi:hypothetical protein
VINEISFVCAKMCNVINNRLKFIKHIQNNFFCGVDIIMISEFYQPPPPMKDNWIFQNIKNNVNALAQNFWQTYVQCYELNKVMQQSDMVFIQTLNKFRTTTKNTKDIKAIIQFVIDNHPDFLLFHIYFTQINLCKNTMKMCSLTH